MQSDLEMLPELELRLLELRKQKIRMLAGIQNKEVVRNSAQFKKIENQIKSFQKYMKLVNGKPN